MSLLNTYTNRKTGRTTVMHGVTLCGYVDRCEDADRRVWARGFYYAVSIARNGAIEPSYCEGNSLRENVDHVFAEWQKAR